MLRTFALFSTVAMLAVVGCKPSQKNTARTSGRRPTKASKVPIKAKEEPLPPTTSPREEKSNVAPDSDDATLDSALAFIISKFPDTKKKCEIFKQNRLGKKIDLGKVSPEQILRVAETYKGVPHSFGGLDRKGIDCSGLVAVSFRKSGVSDFPHGSEEQAYLGKIILGTHQLQRGDLVFFINTYQTSNLITHVGICLNNHQFIHSTTSKGVIVSDFKTSEYWRKHYAFATRLFTSQSIATNLGK